MDCSTPPSCSSSSGGSSCSPTCAGGRRWRRPGRWAGFFVGAGGFQVFDGLVNHKVLRIHQIRYDVHVLPYDIAWNAFGGLLVLIGVWLLARARSSRRPARPGRA